MKKLTISIIAIALLATVAYPGTSSALSFPAPNEQWGIEQPGSRRPCTVIDSNLSFGSRDRIDTSDKLDTSVNRMQLILKFYGFLKVEPTGYFGLLTREAVKEFQRKHGLPPTGFFGPLSRGVMKKITCADDMPMPVESITYQISTDKSIYDQDDKITITITARNTTDTPKTFRFTNGCQTDYTIDNIYTYLAARLCIQATSEVVIPAGESKTWTMTHNPDEFRIPAGRHTITAKVVGYGEAKTTIVVEGVIKEGPTVTVTAPNGGEILRQDAKTTIKWKSHMPYPTFAAVRHTIFLERKYICTAQVCPAIAYAPYIIAKNVRGDSYVWKVGSVDTYSHQSLSTVPSGEYWIRVCMDGETVCDTSDKPFTITSSR